MEHDADNDMLSKLRTHLNEEDSFTSLQELWEGIDPGTVFAIQVNDEKVEHKEINIETPPKRKSTLTSDYSPVRKRRHTTYTRSPTKRTPDRPKRRQEKGDEISTSSLSRIASSTDSLYAAARLLVHGIDSYHKTRFVFVEETVPGHWTFSYS